MTINTPGEPGAFEGDVFFGDTEDSTRATHVYVRREWVSIVHPKLDHSAMAGNISDIIPGTEAIPDDMPNAEHGDMSLEYNMQNFNALVAANTAMTSELAGAQAQINLLVANGEEHRDAIVNYEKAIADLRNSRTEDRADYRVLNETNRDQAKTIKEMAEAHKEMSAKLEYEKDRVNALGLQLERTKGYLDRTLEQDEQYDTASAVPEQRISRPRGPRIGDIPMPVRSGDGYRVMEAAFPGDRIRSSAPPAPRTY